MTPGLIEWGVAELALPGQTENGDRHVAQPFAGGILLAVVDGLGHGRDAAAAATIAVSTLERFPLEPLAALFRRCHESLRRTRGVAMSAASFAAGEQTMAWLGVGNVEGVLLRASPGGDPLCETLLSRGGVVGSLLPRLSVSVLTVQPGDMLMLATDGIRDTFAAERPFTVPPQQAARRILARHARGTDDALVLVARYLGGAR